MIGFSSRVFCLAVGLGIFGITAFAADAESGKKLFQSTGKSANKVACVTCHDAPGAAGENVLKPGHSLANVLGRPTFWGGTLKSFAEAADYCAQKYMQLEGLSAADKADLESYAETLGRETQPALVLAKRNRKQVAEVVKLTGDLTRGKEIADTSCIQCHGKKGPGPVLDETLSPVPIIVVILSSGGKIMPFFSIDRLNDQQVADVAAYVGSINRSNR